MRLSLQTLLFAFLALFATLSFAVAAEQKAVIVSYPDSTPDSVLDQAKEAILSAGGSITHEYVGMLLLVKGGAY